MLDPEKAAEGVIKSVKDFVARAVAPLTNHVDELDAKFKEVGKLVNETHEKSIAHAISEAILPVEGKIESMEARMTDASQVAIAKATEPFTLKLVEVDARLAEAANTERFRPFLEIALDAVRKEGGTVDEKLGEIEKRLEDRAAATLCGAVGPLEIQVGVLIRDIEKVSKAIPLDVSEDVETLKENMGATVVRLDGCEKQFDAKLSELAAGIDPLDRKLAGLTERVEEVAKAIPADATGRVREAREEIAAVSNRIDGIEPRLEEIAKAGPELVAPLIGKIDDLSGRFGELSAANDALQEQILKSVDVQIEQAVERLPRPKDGEPGAKGDPGKDAEAVDVEQVVAAVVARVPVPKDGEPGAKGDPGDPAPPVDVEHVIAEVVARIPAPRDGIDGKDGAPADPQILRAEVEKAVADLPKPDFNFETITGLVVEEVKTAVAAIPAPKDGKDGQPGRDAEPVNVNQILSDIVAQLPKPKEGERGPPGESVVGPKGEPGEKGETGAFMIGAKGDRGEAGPSAYQLALEEGFVGTKSQWLSTLIGKSGDDGRDGKDGRDAREPRDGINGEPGRDAAQIEVLSAIDTSKSVPRGTFASHRGGLWRAARNTDPGEDLHLCGWQSIVEGFPEIEISQGDDLRTFTLRTVSSTGRTMEKSFSLPVVLDRGVFKSDKTYEPGDSISYRGCAWIAQTQTQAVPGTNEEWRMSVKAGRDGKDGELLPPKPPQQVRLK